jgi:hypothetical protein
VKQSYRKDYWEMQPNYCELWCEKDAIIGSIQDLTDQLGLTVRVGRGSPSATRINNIAKHLNSVNKANKTVFYLGDHDPSGQDIQRAAHVRVQQRARELWLSDRDSFPEEDDLTPWFDVERIAIHPADIKKLTLPPLRIRTKEDGEYADPRANNFVKKHGKQCVELDALPPTELRRRIQKAVESKLDVALWNRAVAIEEVELRSIVETVSRWPGLKAPASGETSPNSSSSNLKGG